MYAIENRASRTYMQETDCLGCVSLDTYVNLENSLTSLYCNFLMVNMGIIRISSSQS